MSDVVETQPEPPKVFEGESHEPSDVLRAIDMFKGNLTRIANYFELRRSSIVSYISNKPELIVALDDWRQSRVDKAEEVIDTLLDAGDGATAKLVVTTLGKDRGYAQRTELANPDGTNIEPTTIVYKVYAPAEEIEEPPLQLANEA